LPPSPGFFLPFASSDHDNNNYPFICTKISGQVPGRHARLVSICGEVERVLLPRHPPSCHIFCSQSISSSNPPDALVSSLRFWSPTSKIPCLFFLKVSSRRYVWGPFGIPPSFSSCRRIRTVLFQSLVLWPGWPQTGQIFWFPSVS